MAMLAATLFAASTQGSTPASPLNCTHVRTISNDSLCDRLANTAVAARRCRCYRTLQDVVTVTLLLTMLQDVTGC